MTLIATHISKFGVVQASDSNMTGGGRLAGAGKKVFDLPFGPGALAVAGTYSVGGIEMDRWMDDCISAFGAGPDTTLSHFAAHLRDRLNLELNDEELADLTIIQIGGYADEGAGAHPVMWFVRNVSGINRDGYYRTPGLSQIQLSEDFWARDYATSEDTRLALTTGGWHSYFNGFPEGRIAYLGLSRSLTRFFNEARSVPTWSFRAPKSLEEVGAIAELELKAMDVMFRVSDYPAQYIGGEPQMRLVTPPPNAIAF